jgi:hypothetical protein
VADAALTGPRRAWTGLPVSARIGLIYLLARIVTTLFLVLAAGMSGPTSRFGGDPDLGDFVVGWDATWYWFTAVNGYPAELPLTDSGAVAENQWAFMPLYAYAASGLGFVLGSWGAGGLLISLAGGYAASLALYALLRPRLDGAYA